jgi:hypothetical protein
MISQNLFMSINAFLALVYQGIILTKVDLPCCNCSAGGLVWVKYAINPFAHANLAAAQALL